MTEQKRYTVIELSEQVGVPRTTINDWLSRYAQYIGSELQGRRRIYLESSLAVLKTISGLRASGMSSFDIDAELAKLYAIHAEPAPEPDARIEEQHSGASHAASPAMAGQKEPLIPAAQRTDEKKDADEPSSSDYPLLSQRQEPDLDQILAESFRQMVEKMDSMEERSRSVKKRLFLWVSVMILLLLFLAAGGLLAILRLQSLSQTNQRMEQDARTQNEALRILSEQTVSLTGSSAELKKSIQNLEAGMEEQKKQFDSSLSEQKKLYEQARTSESEKQAAELAKKEIQISLEREKFAQEKLILLRNMERLGADQEAVINELQQKLKDAEARGKTEPANTSDAQGNAGSKETSPKEMKSATPVLPVPQNQTPDKP